MYNRNIYVSIVIAFAISWPVYSAVYSSSDILGGDGNFEFNGLSGPWMLSADDGELSTVSNSLALSGSYAWKAGPTTAGGKDLRVWTEVNTFANRSHKIIVNVRYQTSTPNVARIKLGSDAWDANMNLAWGNTYFEENTKYYTTKIGESSPQLTATMYSDSANDTIYMDDISVYRERCIPEPNVNDSLGGTLIYGQNSSVLIDCNQGIASSGYTKNFDPDITVSSPYAIIHSYRWISDKQISVELTAIYGGNIYLTLRNESSKLEAIHTMLSQYPAGPFSLNSEEFPIVFFDVNPGTTHYELVRTCGANYVHRFGSQSSPSSGIAGSIDQITNYMNLIQPYGMKLMVNMTAHAWILESDGLSSLQQIAAGVKDHPSMGFWLLTDEPEIRDRQDPTGQFPASVIQPYYTMLKSLAPNIPVAITHAEAESSSTNANWWDYANCEDIFMPDGYPVNAEPFPTAPIQSSTDWVRTATGATSDTLIPTLQLHNRSTFGEVGCRYPNAVEIRYWCYATIIQGCRGLSWYSYYRSLYPNGTGGALNDAWLEDTFRPVGQEIRKLAYLAAPIHQPDVLLNGGTGTNDLYMAVWQRTTGYWVTLVNGNGTARTVTINTSGKIMNASLKPWGMTREAGAKIVNGQMSLHLQPWESFVWTAQDSADLNKDGYVNYSDLQEITLHWLESSN